MVIFSYASFCYCTVTTRGMTKAFPRKSSVSRKRLYILLGFFPGLFPFVCKLCINRTNLATFFKIPFCRNCNNM